MSFELEIENGTISGTYEGLKLASVPEQRLVDYLVNLRPKDTGLLPPVVRHISPSRKFVIFERPPGIKKISFVSLRLDKIIEGKTKYQEYSLPMPWTVYAVGISDKGRPYPIYVFARNAPLSSSEDA